MGKLLQEEWMEEKRKEANFSGRRFKITGKYAFTMTETKNQKEYCYEWENELVDYLKAHQKEIGVYSYYKNEGKRPIKNYVIYYEVERAIIKLKVQSESNNQKLNIKGYVKKENYPLETALSGYVDFLSVEEKISFIRLVNSLSTYFSTIEPHFRVRIATGKMRIIYTYSVQSVLKSLGNKDTQLQHIKKLL